MLFTTPDIRYVREGALNRRHGGFLAGYRWVSAGMEITLRRPEVERQPRERAPVLLSRPSSPHERTAA